MIKLINSDKQIFINKFKYKINKNIFKLSTKNNYKFIKIFNYYIH